MRSRSRRLILPSSGCPEGYAFRSPLMSNVRHQGKVLSGLIQLKQQVYAEIESRYTCDHLNREVRLRFISDGRTSYVSQCVGCGHTSTPIRTKAALAQSPNPPPYDVFLQQLHRTTKHEEYLQAYLAIRPALAAEYVAYLAAPDWRERRNQAMERAGGRCEICARPAVDVHHRTYRNVGAEPPQDLLAVCRSCHSVIHGHTGP